MSLMLQQTYYYEIADVFPLHEYEIGAERYVSSASADEWVGSGQSQLHPNDHRYVSNPSTYAATWLSVDEVEQVCSAYANRTATEPTVDTYTYTGLRAIVAMMRVLNEIPKARSRLVLWFNA